MRHIDLVLLQNIQSAEGDQYGVADNHAQYAHGKTSFYHVGLLDKTGGIGDGVRRGRDRERHGA